MKRRVSARERTTAAAAGPARPCRGARRAAGRPARSPPDGASAGALAAAPGGVWARAGTSAPSGARARRRSDAPPAPGGHGRTIASGPRPGKARCRVTGASPADADRDHHAGGDHHHVSGSRADGPRDEHAPDRRGERAGRERARTIHLEQPRVDDEVEAGHDEALVAEARGQRRRVARGLGRARSQRLAARNATLPMARLPEQELHRVERAGPRAPCTRCARRAGTRSTITTTSPISVSAREGQAAPRRAGRSRRRRRATPPILAGVMRSPGTKKWASTTVWTA